MRYLLTHIETNRIIFRALSADDFDAWMPLFALKEVAIFLDMDQKLTQRERCQQWFDKSFHRQENNLGIMHAIIDKKTGQLVGQCGLLIQTIQNTERLEIGYSILPEFWGRGYASEAATTFRDYAFENNLADSLISMVHVDNIASEKVAIKNGMAFEKQIGSFHIFSITKEQWISFKST
jgi:RimJ/RimL family protein N-acetyltransferase|tara:strand:+ start:36950 stop:37486 length:537 start_codon:yes stop_codon:yes gene_type:complete